MTEAAPDPLRHLTSLLFNIPPEKFSVLVHDLESRRRAGSPDDNVDSILDRLRPRLAIMQPKRAPTIKRLLCDPFEDVLYNSTRDHKPIGRIPRNVLGYCWDVLREEIGEFDLDRIERDITEVDGDDLIAIDLAGAELWQLAATCFNGLLATARRDRDARQSLEKRLGGELGMDSLRYIAGFLDIGPSLISLRRSMSRPPIEQPTSTDVLGVAEAIGSVNLIRPDRLEYLIYVVLGRMTESTDVLDILRRVGEDDPELPTDRMLSTAGEAIASQIEAAVAEMEFRVDSDTNADNLARQAGQFVETLRKAGEAARATGSRQHSRQIEQITNELARQARNQLVEIGDQDITKLTRSISAGDWGTNEENSGDEIQAIELLQGRVTTLKLMTGFSDDLRLSDDIDNRLDQIRDAAKSAASQIREQISAGDIGDEPSRRRAYAVIRLVELTSGSEDADRLRQRLVDYIKAIEAV